MPTACRRWPRPAPSLFAMELMPRISRAQSMDVLSSQANLAGYKAVVDAAAVFARALPMMMTAAGTVPAARVFVMGVGVAGLQAIATARRLGAIVTATDVRPAVKEQVRLARRQIHRGRGRGVQAGRDRRRLRQGNVGRIQEEAGGARGRAHQDQDIVITTALIPGRPAPKLISKAMIESMKPGLDHRRSRGRARRQCRARQAGRGGGAQRRAHHGQAQSAGAAAGQCLEPLCPQSARLRRADDRQEDRGARRQLGRRDRQGHADRARTAPS